MAWTPALPLPELRLLKKFLQHPSSSSALSKFWFRYPKKITLFYFYLTLAQQRILVSRNFDQLGGCTSDGGVRRHRSCTWLLAKMGPEPSMS